MSHISTCGRGCPGEPHCSKTWLNAYGKDGQMGHAEAWAAFFGITVEQWANATTFKHDPKMPARGSKQGYLRGFRQLLMADEFSGEIDA